MDLTLTQSFIAVVESGALTRAADRLGVTQSALSRRIQQYERQLGVELLSRGRQGVELTEAGRIAYEEGRRLLAAWQRLKNEIALHQGLESGQVRIGGGATAVSFILPPAIAEFQRRHPRVRFQLKEAGSAEIAEDVLRGQLELGIVTLPLRSHELQARPLVEDDIVLVARRNHPLARRGQIRLSDLGSEGFVGFEAGTALRQLIDNAMREAGVEPQVMMELRSIPSILRMVVTTGHLAFVSRLALADQQEVVELKVEGLRIQRRLAVISRQRGRLSAATDAFQRQLMEQQQ